MSTSITNAPTQQTPSQSGGQATQIVTSISTNQQQQAKALVSKIQQGLSLAAHLKPVSSQKVEIQVGGESLKLDLPRSLPNLSEQTIQISGKTSQSEPGRLLLTLTGFDPKSFSSAKPAGQTLQTGSQTPISVQSSLPQNPVSGQLSLSQTIGSGNQAIDQFLAQLTSRAPALASGSSQAIPNARGDIPIAARLLQIISPGQTTTTPNLSPASTALPQIASGQSNALTLVGMVQPQANNLSGLNGLLGAQSQLSNQPLTLQTDLGLVRLPSIRELPAGTRIQMALLPLPQSTPFLPSTSSQGSAPEIAGFSRLSQSLSALPQNERGQIDALFPKADQQLAKASLFLAGLLREGQGDQWLSKDHIKALDNASPQLGQQISNEIGSLRPQAFLQAADGSEWLKLVLPMFGQQQTDDLSLFWQKQDSEGQGHNGEQGPKSQRFIIETRFTQFGLMQLDGRYMADEKKLDLMVRTRTTLDPAIRNGIRDRYHDVMQAGGLKGMIDFHVTSAFPVEDPDRPHVDSGLKV